MSDETFTEMCNAFQRLIDAHCQSKSPFHNPVNANAVDALRTLRSYRLELAASREREAQMRKLVGFLLIVARTAGDAMPETHTRIVSEAEAALAEGAQR